MDGFAAALELERDLGIWVVHIILNDTYRDFDGKTEKHEWGHTRQSLLLGPLYLPLVGLPSLLWATWWTPLRSTSYFRFFTERWADRLGGVRREP